MTSNKECVFNFSAISKLQIDMSEYNFQIKGFKLYMFCLFYISSGKRIAKKKALVEFKEEPMLMESA